jgi:hypothetical protein
MLLTMRSPPLATSLATGLSRGAPPSSAVQKLSNTISTASSRDARTTPALHSQPATPPGPARRVVASLPGVRLVTQTVLAVINYVVFRLQDNVVINANPTREVHVAADLIPFDHVSNRFEVDPDGHGHARHVRGVEHLPHPVRRASSTGPALRG